MRIAVGNSFGWPPYSVPKQILASEVSVRVLGGRLEVEIQPSCVWQVKRDCTLTHVYLIDGDSEARLKLDAPAAVFRGDEFRIARLKTFGPDTDTGHDPYLV